MRTFSLSILYSFLFFFFFFNDTATTEIYTLSLHDALPISLAQTPPEAARRPRARGRRRSANRCRGGDRAAATAARTRASSAWSRTPAWDARRRCRSGWFRAGTRRAVAAAYRRRG